MAIPYGEVESTPSSASIPIRTPPSVHARSEIAQMVRGIAIARGIDPEAFLWMAQIESGLNPNAYNRHSKAAGLFQFIPSTARVYELTDPFDPKANASAAARLWHDNASGLRKLLKREPSAGEIYLAHQQGLYGAGRLLTNPNQPATELVGLRAVTLNGGTRSMTAYEFAQRWTSKFQ